MWAHEAHAFTPWLLANADALGEVLHMDLALTGAEHAVGGYSLDLIGIDETTGESVIVENQLETTDHAHLGQLLTYAAGTDAVNIVWVAAEFRPEHRAALDWLNQRTDTGTRFFGVEVAAVRIGDSLPAPLFQLMAEPNDWGKRVRTRTQAQEGAASERNLKFQLFWERFISRVRDSHPDWTRARSAPAQNWFPMSIGLSSVSLTCSFGKRGLQSELYLQDKDPAVNIARFEALEARREQLDAAYGRLLLYEPLEHRKGCRIADLRPGSIEDIDQWDTYIGWRRRGETPGAEAQRQKPRGGERLSGSVASSEACGVVRGPTAVGQGESRAREIGAKATEAAKSLEAQPPWAPRRMGRGTLEMVMAGTGEALPGPAACV